MPHITGCMALLSRPIVLAGCAMVCATAMQVASAADRSFEVYGFVQADYIQDFGRVNPDWDDTLRPSRIPTVDGLYGADGQSIISVRQSRFGVQAALPVAGTDLYTKFEVDLFGVGADQGKTTIRPRHIYGEWGSWLAGQTNSLFMDSNIFPNTIDYWGPSGMVFLRNPQIRWTPLQGATRFAVALEKPGNDVDTGLLRQLDPDLAAGIQNTEEMPDVTAQLSRNADWGHVQAAVLLRKLGYETRNDPPGFAPDNEPSDSMTGWGVDLTGSFRILARDKLMWGVVYGEGIASYMNDGGVDVAPKGRVGDAKGVSVPLLGITAYYDHYWSEALSTSIGYSRTSVENQNLQAGDAFEKGEYASGNILYVPARNLLVGAEVLWGRRTDNNGASGSDSRVQFTVKYSFSSKDFAAASP